MKLSDEVVRAVMDLLYSELGEDTDIVITCLKYRESPMTISTRPPEEIDAVYKFLADCPIMPDRKIEPRKLN